MVRFFKIFSLILLFIFTTSLASSEITLKVNNKNISSDATPFIKSGTTYVPIRFIADALDVDSISWNSDNKSVSIKNSSSTILLFVNKNYAYVNNEYKNLANNALIHNDRTFVPIRFISEILGASVDWDEKNSSVLISTENTKQPEKNPSSNNTLVGKPSSNSSNPHKNPSTSNNNTTITQKPSDYSNNNISTNSSTSAQNADAIYWLSRIIEAEAGGEPFDGKVAVGEVILNRVESDEFPNTIWSVIFDKKFGIQFEPVANGSIYNTPSEESIKAAKVALNGSNYIGDCLYFLNPKIASSNWIVKNRKFYTTIENHDFYV